MRVLVAVLATLAAFKIYAQDQTYRSAVTDALVAAYRSHAIAACQNDHVNQPKNTGALLWSNPSEITVTIGSSDVEIGMWNVDDELWDAAYKTPYLVLSPSDPLTPLKCTYDITSGSAKVSQTAT